MDSAQSSSTEPRLLTEEEKKLKRHLAICAIKRSDEYQLVSCVLKSKNLGFQDVEGIESPPVTPKIPQAKFSKRKWEAMVYHFRRKIRVYYALIQGSSL